MAYKEKADKVKYNNSYITRSYDRINLLVPKGRKDDIKELAQRKGETVNSLINRLIESELALDSIVNH